LYVNSKYKKLYSFLYLLKFSFLLTGGIKSIPGIGRQTFDLLNSSGICSLHELQSSSLGQLVRVLGSREKAQVVQKLSFGIDDTPVKPSGKPKSVGIEDACKEIKTVPDAEAKIKTLATRLLELLVSQEEKRQPGTLKLTIRKILKTSKEWKRESRQMPFSSLPPIESDDFVAVSVCKLMPLLMDLFGKMVSPGEIFHLTLVGVAFANFTDRKVGMGSISAFLQPVAKRLKSDESSSSKVSLPPDVDPEVFSALPPDVQEEILDDWRSRNNFSMKQESVKKKQSIKDYFGKK